MPSALPAGEPAPASGELPTSAFTDAEVRPLGIYVHVPFCASRCGYCDFNTYTATELGGGASRAAYAETAIAELDLARRVMTIDERRASTVFFGGGTPTLLTSDELGRVLGEIDRRFGLTDDAEITTEANPESVAGASLQALRAAGFTRISFGMQSVAPHVLATLDRRHTPGRSVDVVAEARSAGFDHVNVDLIYGTPGETDEDWQRSLDAAIGSGADHVSAYSLIVEPGTRLAARINRGELPMPVEDMLADRYAVAERSLTSAGYEWYEVSNWASSRAARSRHNLLYWQGGDWWGIGPGAHSHIGGVRWWNVRHPRDYAGRLMSGQSPAASREVLTPGEQHTETVMLRLRLADGLPLAVLDAAGRRAAESSRDAGLLGSRQLAEGRAVLTFRGRLLADAVVRDLLG